MADSLTPELKHHAQSALLDAFRFRRAIKAFDDSRELAPEDFEFILEAARLTASSNGLEPWNIFVLREPALRAKFVQRTAVNPEQAAKASHLVAITAKTAKGLDPDTSPYLAHIAAEVKGMTPDQIAAWRPGFKVFLADRMEVLGSDDAMFGYTARQAYMALQSMLVAASVIAVDSCPLEGLIHSQATAVLAEAGLIDPETDRFAVAAVFGHRAADPKRPQARRPLGEVVIYS
ncbi:MAG: nitroreductase family protein [Bifidobacteriaceae bacterium]|jgi:nitroreductase|nr:nitroreductase family protein [Bifidobacteriaceae bacterium]